MPEQPTEPQGAETLRPLIVAHFYHLYADGQWQDALEEHFSALARTRFDGPLCIGIVGSGANRQRAMTALARRDIAYTPITAPSGYEHVTLNALRTYVRRPDCPARVVMYAHTKGAGNPGRWQDNWRREMTALIVRQWHELASRLDHGEADAAGCHHLTPQEHGHRGVHTPMLAGNYWLARRAFLRKLPELGPARHDAETWIGSGERPPRVIDLAPGWPACLG